MCDNLLNLCLVFFFETPCITIIKGIKISQVSKTIVNPEDDLVNTYKEFAISCLQKGFWQHTDPYSARNAQTQLLRILLERQ